MPNVFGSPRRRAGVVACAALAVATACRRGERDATAGYSSAAATAGLDARAAAPRSASDYGPGADVATLRAAWRHEASGDDIVLQIVAVGRYGVVEVRNRGRSGPFLVLFKRDSAGRWEDQEMIVGALATCGLASQGVPEDVAERIVAHDARLAAIERADPRAGCPGGI